MHLGMLVPTAVFGAASAVGFFIAQRKAAKVKLFQQEELDVTQVQGLGVSKVLGVVSGQHALQAPLSGAGCMWYRLDVQEYVRSGRVSRWVSVHREVAHTTFLLKDRKTDATLEVDPTGAEVKLASEGGSEDRAMLAGYLAQKGKTRLLGFGELRAIETTLQAGEKVFVLGTVGRGPNGLLLQKGDAPFVLSDTDAGQVAYQENTAMYLARFWGGACALVSLWWLWQVFRR